MKETKKQMLLFKKQKKVPINYSTRENRNLCIVIIACLFLSLFFYPNSSFAKGKDSDCPQPSRKALKIYKKTQQGNVPLSERHILLLKAVKADPNFLMAYDDLAEISLKQAKDATNPVLFKQYTNRTLGYWQKIMNICPAYRDYYIPFQFAQYYYGKKDYKTAKQYVTQYLNGNKRQGDEKNEALKMKKGIDTYFHIMNNPVPFSPHKVQGVSTNTHDEFLPMLSPDNNYMFYTRKTKIESHTAIKNDNQQDILTRSTQMMPNHFSPGLYMPKPFNAGQDQGGVSISANDKTLYITIVTMQPDPRPEHTDPQTNQHPLLPNGDIYYSTEDSGVWSPLKSVGPGINQPYSWEGQPSISSDGQTLYFVRYYPFLDDQKKHPEHIGMMDIYESKRLPNGKWGKAVDLGDSINTPLDDKTPFIHSDSKTLYFSSNGRIGVGGYDIYYSRLKKDGHFSHPKDLGYPINTTGDEVDFIVSRDGKTAYYASNKDNPTYDIYDFKLYESARPDQVVFVDGKISDSTGHVPADTKVVIKNASTGEVRQAVIDKSTGKYVAVVAVDSSQNDNLVITAKKKGYAFSSQLITTQKGRVNQTKKAPLLALKPIKVGQNYKINNINFATDSYLLNKDSKDVLNEFISFLNLNPTVKIQIQGYTDNVGGTTKNLALSQNRAMTVYQYLIAQGINKSRLSYKGFGEASPVASNDTAAGRAKNRRTTFLIVGK